MLDTIATSARSSNYVNTNQKVTVVPRIYKKASNKCNFRLSNITECQADQ